MSQSVREELYNLVLYGDRFENVIAFIERMLSGLEMEEEDLVKGSSNFDMTCDVNDIKEERNGIIREFNTKLKTLKAQLQEEKNDKRRNFITHW